jgi:hypothetical protein
MSYKKLAELILVSAAQGTQGVTKLRELKRDYPAMWGHALILAADMFRDLLALAEFEAAVLESEAAPCGS